MRRIEAKRIREVVSELCIEANINLRRDVLAALKKGLKAEKNKTAKTILKEIIENARIAKKERLPMCQDTGMVAVYCDIGQDVLIARGDLSEAINEGARDGYRKGYLRKSIVKSPIVRINTGKNTPPVIYTDIVKGNKVGITVVPKGFGSENKSKQCMLNPTAGEKEIVSFAIEVLKEAGPDACPPYILGVGLGGTFDKAAHLAKEALILPVGKPNPKKYLRKLEKEIMKKANSLGIGPMGFGGKTTCLGVNILEYPTHIAGLPVAVNLGCHITRSAGKVI